MLKRLEDALRDQDRVYAVIKGGAVNNDGGRRLGFVAPSVEGQVEAINTALAAAEVVPTDIALIETHVPVPRWVMRLSLKLCTGFSHRHVRRTAFNWVR